MVYGIRKISYHLVIIICSIIYQSSSLYAGFFDDTKAFLQKGADKAKSAINKGIDKTKSAFSSKSADPVVSWCSDADFQQMPFNTITQVCAHNATSAKKSIVHVNPVADQKWTIKEMLTHGIRAFKLPIHPVGSTNEPYIAHTLQEQELREYLKKVPNSLANAIAKEASLIDTTRTRLVSFLEKIKSFLDANPNEVITLLLNTFDLDLQRTPGSKTMNEQILENFQDTGLINYLYYKTPDEPWATLGTMIKQGKRLVVISDDPIQSLEGKILFRDLTYVETDYTFKSTKDLLADAGERIQNHPLTEELKRNNGINFFWLLHHYITGVLSGSSRLAEKANTYEMIKQHIENCKGATDGRNPTLIQLDFVNIGFDSVSKLVQELNQENQKKLSNPQP